MATYLRIECRGCRRVTEMDPAKVTPFEHNKLVCSHCRAREPVVTEQERRVPFTPEYEKPPVARVWKRT